MARLPETPSTALAYEQELAAASDEATVRDILKRALKDSNVAHRDYHALALAARERRNVTTGTKPEAVTPEPRTAKGKAK